MKIKSKLSLLFTLLAAVVLLAFAFLVYFSASKSREAEFYKSLKKEATTKANLFLNAKVDAGTLQTIYKNNREILNEVEVAIYDTAFHLLYHDAEEIDFVKESREMMDHIQAKKFIQFYQNNWQVLGMQYRFEKHNYIVVAAAFDQYGYRKLKSLGQTILIVLLCSILFTYALGRFFSTKVLEPLVVMNARAREISATNLHLRLESKGKDELAELAATFNQVLEKLEQSFDAQKDVVSNISHELRTPLSAMMTELQLAGNKERSIEEYKAVIYNALHDAQKMARLCSSLLDFAKASYDAAVITFKDVRLDEVLLDAQAQATRSGTGFTVSMMFESETDNEVLVKGNAYLLQTAFANLMENACKFSADQHCNVSIATSAHESVLKFSDKGIGIPKEDIEHIFTPFYRGHNKGRAHGNGIGLSLSKKIIELHRGHIQVISALSAGTTFTVSLPNSVI